MDLHFAPFDRAQEVAVLPGDLAALFGVVTARQATSPTAAAQARWQAATDPLLFRPLDGAFNAMMAGMCARWREG